MEKELKQKMTVLNERAKPFVKWAGGKRSIISELTKRLPSNLGTYYEAFVGGGALFFEIHDKIEKAVLVDNNLDLVTAYYVIKKDPEKLIKALVKHAIQNNDDYYYRIRKQHDLEDPIQVAARLIYLNRTCFNGLYRVNKKGEFNVPVGRYKDPNIIQEENIMACSRALQKATIRYGDFADITPNKSDFVYFDPPYHPINDQSFTGYCKLGFTEEDQERLRDFAITLHGYGMKVMLSNSNTEFIRSLYENSIFNTSVINAPRSINCKGNKRNKVEEVLITNY